MEPQSRRKKERAPRKARSNEFRLRKHYISKTGEILLALLTLLEDQLSPGNTWNHLFEGSIRAPGAAGATGATRARPSFLMYVQYRHSVRVSA